VDLHDRRVNVENHRVAAMLVNLVADLGADVGQRARELRARGSLQLLECPEHRRVRRHRAEQIALRAQVLDVAAALTAPGEHERHLDEDLAPVVQRHPLALRGDPL
jgi:hypothetical protein